ncbi:hypothetical protein [Streptomyces indiaensis]|uniref:Uncharacterized protein n=1 Tax=Streptomyces indiaensis TaxID=284033 RepID=A0ABN3DM23_9ACTN|nr:hypothetical protein [Streptomyces indiaensis]MCF1646025.1 hypothetical protein [Streptomyces indiaensis]
MSTKQIPEPVVSRPWRSEDGPRPRVTTWPYGKGPVLAVWSHGKWRDATVQARQDWADGTVHYQVEVDLRGDRNASTRMYRWPQPGLRDMRQPRG